MKITKIGHTLTMNSMRFDIGSVKFLITGTRIESDRTEVDVKNLSNGKTATLEHQSLCKKILYAQSIEPIKKDKSITKYRQTGINL